MSLSVHVLGIGVYGPGLNGWPQTAAVLRGEHAYAAAPIQIPVAEALPPAERRRAGVTIKLAFAAGFEAVRSAGADPSALASVFASSGGDSDNCHAILETLASSDRAVSPTRFHNSVHNAPSGYWSIATGCRAPSTSLCAYDGSFAAGLLEAAAQVHSTGLPCILVAYDAPYPAPLGDVRPISHPFGVALLLSPHAAPGSLGQLEIALGESSGPGPDRLSGPDELEAMRLGVPAARSLPLLAAMARRDAGTLRLDYLDGLTLDVTHQPLA